MASLKNKLFAGKTFLWMRKNRKPLCIAVACLLAALLVFAFPIKQEDALTLFLMSTPMYRKFASYLRCAATTTM